MCITDVCHATQTLVFQTAQFVGTTPLVNGFQSSAASRRSFTILICLLCGRPNYPAKAVWLWHSYQARLFGCLIYADDIVPFIQIAKLSLSAG